MKVKVYFDEKRDGIMYIYEEGEIFRLFSFLLYAKTEQQF